MQIRSVEIVTETDSLIVPSEIMESPVGKAFLQAIDRWDTEKRRAESADRLAKKRRGGSSASSRYIGPSASHEAEEFAAFRRRLLKLRKGNGLVSDVVDALRHADRYMPMRMAVDYLRPKWGRWLTSGEQARAIAAGADRRKAAADDAARIYQMFVEKMQREHDESCRARTRKSGIQDEIAERQAVTRRRL